MTLPAAAAAGNAPPRRWWPAVKAALGVAIVGFVGWQLLKQLRQPDLWVSGVRLRPAWVAASVGFYVAGLACWGGFWRHLLRLAALPPSPPALRGGGVGGEGDSRRDPNDGQRQPSALRQSGPEDGQRQPPSPRPDESPSPPTPPPRKAGGEGGKMPHHLSDYAIARAYVIGHLGKYVPGKAWAVLLRVAFMERAGVRPGVTVLTATYETLTTMAAGALVAAVAVPWVVNDGGTTLWQALGLLAVAGVPILPGVFNRLADRVARPFRNRDVTPLPTIPTSALLTGLAMSGVGWLWLGGSLFAMLQAIVPTPLPLTWHVVGVCIAANAVSYVAGFLALPAPGGLGVREAILQALLARAVLADYDAAVGAGLAAAVAVALRLAWTLTEVVLAAGLFAIPPRPPEPVP